MNDAQKLDAILAAVQTPPAATIDTAALTAAVSSAVTTALAPVLTQLTVIAAGIADIQGEVDEPAASGASSASGASTAGAPAAAKPAA
jgi:hypothetical protein